MWTAAADFLRTTAVLHPTTSGGAPTPAWALPACRRRGRHRQRTRTFRLLLRFDSRLCVAVGALPILTSRSRCVVNGFGRLGRAARMHKNYARLTWKRLGTEPFKKGPQFAAMSNCKG